VSSPRTELKLRGRSVRGQYLEQFQAVMIAG